MTPTLEQRKGVAAEPQGSEPILCRCWAWRHGLMGDHRDWLAELRRNRALGLVPDDFYFAAVTGEARLGSAEVAS